MDRHPSRGRPARRRSAVLAAAILLAVVGCHERPVDPADRVQSIEIVSPSLSLPLIFVEGRSISMQVRASDARGEPVAGAALTFQVVDGGGSVAPSEAVTDESGMAAVTYTPGSGANAMEMEAAGLSEPARFAIVAQPRVQVDFEEDAVKLAGIGCDHTFFARVLANGQLALGSSVQFSATREGMLDLVTVTGATGNYRGMLTAAFGVAPGTTELIATHASGAADTVVVEVGDAPPTITIHDLVIASGSTVTRSADPRGACGDPVYGTTYGDWDPTRPSFASLAPDVVQVERAATGADFTVSGLKRGTALVEARYHGAADTARVEVRDVVLEPADTTVRVGDIVHYRFLVSDTSGALVPSTGTWGHTDGGVAEMTGAGVFRAVAAGVDTIGAFTLPVDGSQRTTVLRVVQP